MKTTNFFIELLVIGIGAVFCLVSALYLKIGDQLLEFLQKLDHPILILPLTAITYVLGIVFDRLFDALVNWKDSKIRKGAELSKEEYNIVRSKYYDESDAVKQVFDYTKSRIRITRAWMFYFFILFIAFMIFAIISKSGHRGLLSFVCLLLSWLTYFAWQKLTISFNGQLKSMNNILSK